MLDLQHNERAPCPARRWCSVWPLTRGYTPKTRRRYPERVRVRLSRRMFPEAQCESFAFVDDLVQQRNARVRAATERGGDEAAYGMRFQTCLPSAAIRTQEAEHSVLPFRRC